jgi:Transmembrane domain of unknown function (DUF3566)
MAKIDISAQEDTGGLDRVSAFSDTPDHVASASTIVIRPVDNADLAAHGLINGANGDHLAGSGTDLGQGFDLGRSAPPLTPYIEDPTGPVLAPAPMPYVEDLTGPVPAPLPYIEDWTGPVPAPPLTPYIEDPTGPVITHTSFDPRADGGGTAVVPVAPSTPASADDSAATIRPGVRLRRRPRPRVRRVKRVIRSIDTWTVFKVSLVFYLAMYVIFLVASVLLWRVANATGTLANIQTFLTHYGWDTFKFHGGEIYHAVWIIGLFLVVGGVGLNVTMSTLFNLIADLVGGIRVTVLEEEVRLRPRVQITKQVMPKAVPPVPTPGEPLVAPPAPAGFDPVEFLGLEDAQPIELTPDLTSDIVRIGPSAES